MRAFAGNALAHPSRSGTYQYTYLQCIPPICMYTALCKLGERSQLHWSSQLSHGDVIARLLARAVEPNAGQSSGYKLRCSAAQCRALVPFGYMLADELCDRSDPVEEAIYFAAFHLNEVYKTLSSDCQEPHRKKSEHGIKFALQYVALHDYVNPGDFKAWRIKPKLHLFLHACADADLPSQVWCYRDEDFGGSAAQRGRRRGGVRSVQAMSSGTLDKFKVHTRFICIR